MAKLGRSPLQRFMLVLTAILSVALHYPHPEFDISQYTSLALNHTSSATIAAPLGGVNIVVTGATGGLGLSLTKTLHKLGGTVIAVGRSQKKLDKLVEEIESDKDDNNNGGKIVPVLSDFNDLEAVANAANQITSNFQSIDYLVNNAGMTSTKAGQSTKQGFDLVFGVNYLSHVLMTEKMLTSLKRSKLPFGSRIIQISSTTHYMVNGDDLLPTDSNSDPPASEPSTSFLHNLKDYANSKLAQIYYARALTRQLKSQQNKRSSITNIVSICPAWVATNIAGSSRKLFLDIFGFKSEEHGLAPILHAMFHQDVGASSVERDGEARRTDYVTNCKISTGRFMSMAETFVGFSFWPEFFRPVVLSAGGIGFLIVQKIFPSIGFSASSRESYDTTKQDALYQWSKEAISPWM